MSKAEFLKELENEIKDLPDYEKAIDYYQEMIDDRMDDGMSEEDAVTSCDSIHMIRERIISETPLQTFIKARTSKTLSNVSIILFVTLFPIWFPIILAFGIVFMALFITAAALIFSFYIVLISLAVAGVFGLISSFFYISTNLPYAIFSIGISLILLALSMLLAPPIIGFNQKIFAGIRWSIEKVKSLFVKRGERL